LSSLISLLEIAHIKKYQMCSQTIQKSVGGQIYVLLKDYKKCFWH